MDCFFWIWRPRSIAEVVKYVFSLPGVPPTKLIKSKNNHSHWLAFLITFKTVCYMPYFEIFWSLPPEVGENFHHPKSSGFFMPFPKMYRFSGSHAANMRNWWGVIFYIFLFSSFNFSVQLYFWMLGWHEFRVSFWVWNILLWSHPKRAVSLSNVLFF